MVRKNKKIYEYKIKPMIDKILSFLGLIILSPLFVIISLLIFIDDPGKVFFTQKRVGKDKNFFQLHKFRSMKTNTPHDIPTHKLKNPDQYLTRVGKFLRKSSLDELPQIWDILRGKMSIIGPRPALWNQNDLIKEREKYSANSVMPGLTGWAQINGRDELEISEKAKLDGEYVKHLRQGGYHALLFDAKCFLGTIKSVMGGDGIVEGGTGVIHENCLHTNSKDKEFEEYGYKKSFNIDITSENQKRVLITGEGSYIGESFKEYVKENYNMCFEVDTIDMHNNAWKRKDFSSYDTVFHVAGIAHADVRKVDEKTKKKYYAVNTKLAIEVAETAKRAGVKQFIFMSSMIIYGESGVYGKKKEIDEYTVPAPTNFYGDSKWQADKGVRKLDDLNFHVAVLRPPMIYGRESKGNYMALARLAKIFPIFPDIANERSMLHIDNLCEFLCQLITSGENGVYFPQNKNYIRTAEMVKAIATVSGKRVFLTKSLNFAVKIGGKIPGRIGKLVNKAFGNNIYNNKLSNYQGLKYQIVDFEESIKRTEGKKLKPKLTVLVLVNHDVVIYNFRLELVEKLLSFGYEVHISSPYGERIKDLEAIGAKYHRISIDRHGMNPIKDMSILMEYRRLIREIHPAVILTYTIKPNIYGGILSRMMNIPFIANITGLGISVENGGVKEKLILYLYRIGLRRAHKVYFQNKDNQRYMLRHNVVKSRYSLLPGSGVNLKKYSFEKYPSDTDEYIFTTFGRIMKSKGIDELLKAAEIIRKRYPKIRFRLIGFFDEDYEKVVYEAMRKGDIEYIEQQQDIFSFLVETHAVIHPSHSEGMSNVLLEAAATGRPVIASNVPGCQETFDEGISGLGFQAKDYKALVETIERFLALPYEQKVSMGEAGRKKMEKEFDRNIVVDKYMKEINSICGVR